MADKTLYKVLQVDPEAEHAVIAAAYRALATKLHPDRDITGVDEIRMKELNRAYEVLRDAQKRRAYDRELASAAVVPVGPGRQAGQPSGVGGLTDRVQALDAEGLSQLRLDFGRYAGWTLGDLARHDPDYLRWLSRHSSGIRYRRAILKLLAAIDAHRSPMQTTR